MIWNFQYGVLGCYVPTAHIFLFQKGTDCSKRSEHRNSMRLKRTEHGQKAADGKGEFSTVGELGEFVPR